MQRFREQRVGRRDLGHFAQIEHHHAVGDVAHDGEIMSDKEISQSEALLQIDQQIDDCAWMLTSSADIGSSAMMKSGRTERARAMEMRWR